VCHNNRVTVPAAPGLQRIEHDACAGVCWPHTCRVV
jgi:hypothetical protein